MAIECCFFRNNTSVLADELLAHRIGLVPIRANPADFEYKEENDATEYVKCF
jgi:DNA-directed RNA polymerases I and III subunit RPAC1